MGYTHYWTRKVEYPREAFSAAVADCCRVVEGCGVPLKGRKYGPRLTDGFHETGILFNGTLDDAHETFDFPRLARTDPARQEDLRESGLTKDATETWAFCKTARKPYDLAVTACLVVLADRLGVEVSSDGGMSDWEAGKALADSILPDKPGTRFRLGRED